MVLAEPDSDASPGFRLPVVAAAPVDVGDQVIVPGPVRVVVPVVSPRLADEPVGNRAFVVVISHLGKRFRPRRGNLWWLKIEKVVSSKILWLCFLPNLSNDNAQNATIYMTQQGSDNWLSDVTAQVPFSLKERLRSVLG